MKTHIDILIDHVAQKPSYEPAPRPRRDRNLDSHHASFENTFEQEQHRARDPANRGAEPEPPRHEPRAAPPPGSPGEAAKGPVAAERHHAQAPDGSPEANAGTPAAATTPASSPADPDQTGPKPDKTAPSETAANGSGSAVHPQSAPAAQSAPGAQSAAHAATGALSAPAAPVQGQGSNTQDVGSTKSSTGLQTAGSGTNANTAETIDGPGTSEGKIGADAKALGSAPSPSTAAPDADQGATANTTAAPIGQLDPSGHATIPATKTTMASAEQQPLAAQTPTAAGVKATPSTSTASLETPLQSQNRTEPAQPPVPGQAPEPPVPGLADTAAAIEAKPAGQTPMAHPQSARTQGEEGMAVPAPADETGLPTPPNKAQIGKPAGESGQTASAFGQSNTGGQQSANGGTGGNTSQNPQSAPAQALPPADPESTADPQLGLSQQVASRLAPSQTAAPATGTDRPASAASTPPSALPPADSAALSTTGKTDESLKAAQGSGLRFTPSQTQNVHTQLAVQIASQFRNGSSKFDIRLDPPELGRIEVQLEVAKDGRVRALVSADNQDTLDLLQRDQRFLQKSLSDAGLDVDQGGLEFSLNENGENPFAQGQNADKGELATAEGVSMNGLDSAPPPPHAEVETYGFRLANQIRLDIAV